MCHQKGVRQAIGGAEVHASVTKPFHSPSAGSIGKDTYKPVPDI